MNPAIAATAGSRLISTPNTPAGIRRSASSSSVYGIADDIIPTSDADRQHRRHQQVGAAVRDPDRRQRHGRHEHRERQPGAARERLPTRALSRMYAAQNAPASRASATPRPSRPAPPKSDSSRMPAAARATQTRSSARREPNTATPSGPTNSKVTAMPSGMRSSDE